MRKLASYSKIEQMNRDLSFLSHPSQESAGILHVQRISPAGGVSGRKSARREESEGSNLKLLVIAPPQPDNEREGTMVTNSVDNTPEPDPVGRVPSFVQEDGDYASA